MRGSDERSDFLFSYVSPEQRVPADHPMRPIRRLVDAARALVFAPPALRHRHRILRWNAADERGCAGGTPQKTPARAIGSRGPCPPRRPNRVRGHLCNHLPGWRTPARLAPRRRIRERGHPCCTDRRISGALLIRSAHDTGAPAISACFRLQLAALSSVTFNAYIPSAGATRLWR